MKCGVILDSIDDEQRIGKYITLCPRDAFIEKNIPDTEEMDSD
ncbi:MAG: hypothetical protein ACRD94_07775 [Nitrosopumilaceae archaeon]